VEVRRNDFGQLETGGFPGVHFAVRGQLNSPDKVDEMFIPKSILRVMNPEKNSDNTAVARWVTCLR
jgi:hypothetical protein